MSSPRFCRLLAVLEDDEPAMWSVLDAAVEVAERERARLTLAQVTDPGWLVRWCGPLAMLNRAGAVPELDLTRLARDRLARAAEMVPASVPLTTVLLARDTVGALRRLMANRPCDLILLATPRVPRQRRLLRRIATLGASTLIVSRRPLSGADLLERSQQDLDVPRAKQ